MRVCTSAECDTSYDVPKPTYAENGFRWAFPVPNRGVEMPTVTTNPRTQIRDAAIRILPMRRDPSPEGDIAVSDVKTLSTTVTVAKGSTIAVAQIWGAAIDSLKEEGKVPQNCLPWAEINVDKTEADKPKKGHEGDRVYHVDVHYRDLQPGETVTADEVITSLLTPPSFDPDEPHDDHA